MELGIALGANLGDRLLQLQNAVKLLGERLTAIEKSPLYVTAPVDCPEGAPDFFNAVIVGQFEGDPADVLSITQRIESQAGRPDVHERARNAPRVVDLDLLYADEISVMTEELTLPHPRIHERRFVLEPLATLRPQLRLPGFDRSIKELLAALQSEQPPLRCLSVAW